MSCEIGTANQPDTQKKLQQSTMADSAFNPGQRGNLNFDGIPENKNIAGDFPLDKSVIESKATSASVAGNTS